MKKKLSLRPYLTLTCACLFIVVAPAGLDRGLRHWGWGTVSLLTLPIRGVKAFGSAWAQAFMAAFGKGPIAQFATLERETCLLRRENERLKEALGRPQAPPEGMVGEVIQRDAASWSSFLWLNLGLRHNRLGMGEVVAKNSPVLKGEHLVGVVEEVSEKKCRVRLLTDAALHPAVRVARGSAKSPSLLLAKGELQGASQPLWRSLGNTLKGVGFNYDYPDEEGPARDLRTGTPVGEKGQFSALPLIREGDLLVTTGMDGVFPKGLSVAVVEHVYPLSEGAFTYEIRAKPTAGDFNSLDTLIVLPPIVR